MIHLQKSNRKRKVQSLNQKIEHALELSATLIFAIAALRFVLLILSIPPLY